MTLLGLKWSWGRKAKRLPGAAAAQPQPLASHPVNSILNQTPFHDGAGLPKFQTTATDHASQDRRTPDARLRIELRNSFTPAQPVGDPRLFAGRRDLMISIIRAIEDHRSHVVVYGHRGVGKTSLLRMLTQAAEQARYIVAYFSCGASSDFVETFRAVAAEIPLLYHRSVSPSSSSAEAGSTLLDHLGDGPITPRTIGDAASKIVGTRVLIILDEFDRVRSDEFRRDVAELIKTLSDVSARVQLVIAGVASDLVELLEHTPAIRRNINAFRVDALPEEAVRELVDNGGRMCGLSFESKAVEMVVAAARGSPYIANLLCLLAGMAALDAGERSVGARDMAAALELAIQEFRGRLPEELLKHLEEDRRLAPSDGAASKGGKADAPGASQVVEHLKRSGVLKSETSSAYAHVVDSLSPYLQLRQVRDTYLNEAA
jgi:hypothetical protein